MSKTSIVIFFTIIVFVTNALWALWMFDTAITVTYTEVSVKQLNQALDQVFAMLPKVAKSGESQAEILEAAKASDPDHQVPVQG